MLDANESLVMKVLSQEEGPDELVGLPNFLTKLLDFLVGVPKLPFKNVSPFVTSLFYCMDSSFSSLSSSMCFP